MWHSMFNFITGHKMNSTQTNREANKQTNCQTPHCLLHCCHQLQQNHTCPLQQATHPFNPENRVYRSMLWQLLLESNWLQLPLLQFLIIQFQFQLPITLKTTTTIKLDSNYIQLHTFHYACWRGKGLAARLVGQQARQIANYFCNCRYTITITIVGNGLWLQLITITNCNYPNTDIDRS